MMFGEPTTIAGPCECGCGQPAPIAKENRRREGHIKGQPVRFVPGHNRRLHRPTKYQQRYVPSHPQAMAKGCVFEHVLVAERALGRYLPLGTEMHHVDGNRQNNIPANLVICQDHSYHMLLHYRAKMRRAGANPDTEKACRICNTVKPLAEFNWCRQFKINGRDSRCRACLRLRAEYRRVR